jgi:Tol biopolymer transport system component
MSARRSTIRTAAAVVAGLALTGGGPAGAAGTAATPLVVRVTVDHDGGEADGDSWSPSVSRDGRFVAFTSVASDLVPGDVDAVDDVFVRDLGARTTTLVSVGWRGDQADGPSTDPAISADGRFVAFVSVARNLVPRDRNHWPDVFVRDLRTGTTERVSVDDLGGDANGGSDQPSISADGRYVAFSSTASDLTPGPADAMSDIFVRDRALGTTTRVTVDLAGGAPNGPSYSSSVSDGGRYVAFSSWADDLVRHDAEGASDVYVRDVSAGTTRLVSADLSGHGETWAHAPSISADGRYVAFYALADTLVVGDTNGTWDVFVRDVVGGTTALATVDTRGGPANRDTQRAPSLSADGRYVTFATDAADLVPHDGNHRSDVFVRDLQAGTTRRVSVAPGGGDASGSSGGSPTIDATGTVVAFQSTDSDLTSGDANSAYDLFVGIGG